MKKILIGLAAAVAVAAGGFFGFQFYTQHRIAAEIEAALDLLRAGGAKASHGKVSFDLWSHTVAITDIASESATQPPVNVKIARIVASGVGQPDAARFSADSIEASDVEIDVAMATPPGLNFSYKAPRITVKDYSGPASLQRPPALSSAIDVYRFAFEQVASITASSISAQSLTGTMNSGAAPSVRGDIAYSGLAMQDIKGGRIGVMKVDGYVFTVNMQPAGKADKLTGNLANIASYDIDINALAAIFDPQKVNDDKYYRAYRQISAGPYIATSEQGLNMRVEGMTIDDVALQPSRLQFPALLAMMQQAGAASPTPTQTRDLIDKAATLYEGVRIGNAEMRGLSMDTPQGPFKLSAIKFNLENGKIGEFALEGLDVRAPTGPVKIGRFALKSLDLAGLLRMTALFSNPAQRPPPDQFLGLFPLLTGIEIKGFVAPFTNKLVTLDSFNLDWGQFVGPVPSQARMTGKATTPIDANDPTWKPLLAAGIDTLKIDTDLGAAWTESSRSFLLDPVALEIGDLVKASARVSLAKVPRQIFSFNPQQATAIAAQVEAGTIELTVRDIGGIDLAVGAYARAQNVGREAARRAIIEGLRTSSASAVSSNPDVQAVVEALARFIETPRTTLTLKLTPLGKVSAMQLIQLLQTDPLIALAQFRLEVSTAL